MLKPLFGSFGSALVEPKIGLKISDPVLGSAQLSRKLMGNFESMFAVFIGHIGHPVQQTENGLSGNVHAIFGVC